MKEVNKIKYSSMLVVSLLALTSCTSSSPQNSAARSPTPNATISVSSGGEISLSKSGFSPKTIKIKKNQNVKWTNSDTVPHRIAVDPHPAHSGLDGFDSEEPIPPKGSFTFSFEKTGSYSYHDESNPTSVQGVIIVE